MNHAAKTNLILFTIAIFLSLIAWFQPGLQTTIVHYLSSLKADEIHTILIERKDIGPVKLKKHGTNWFLQEPYQLPANPLRVNTITALAGKRSYTQFQVTDTELARYQLDTPAVSIWLNNNKFILGSTDPIKQQRYVMNIEDNIQSESTTVHLINGVIFYQLRAALDTFISPNLLPPQAKIKSITWLDKELTLAPDGWHLTPAAPDITSDSIAQLVQFWKQAQAAKVETDVTLTIDNQELIQSKSIIISFVQPQKDKETTIEKIQYLIIQDGKQIKLLRTDIQIAYWISPQTLKLISEFFPAQTMSVQ